MIAALAETTAARKENGRVRGGRGGPGLDECRHQLAGIVFQFRIANGRGDQLQDLDGMRVGAGRVMAGAQCRCNRVEDGHELGIGGMIALQVGPRHANTDVAGMECAIGQRARRGGLN